ncbi:MAG: hypothetical protein QXI58_00865 [Candidatus Micrarchaeia archaeon]
METKTAIIKQIVLEPDLKTREEIIKSITFSPKKDKVYVYLVALGAGEYWGPNKNGDFFPESELKKYYKTFENALVYRRHIHKKEKAIGKVLKAFWNDKMKRVELLVEIEKDKAPDVVEKLDKGEVIDFSMGVSIKFDVCSICGNRSYVKTDYCDHIKNHLLEILPDGRQVYMINYGLNFFDISVVIRRADITAISLMKVAKEKGNEYEVNDNLDLAAKRLMAMIEPIEYEIIKKLLLLTPAKRKGIAFCFGLLIKPEQEEFFEAKEIELPDEEEVEKFKKLIEYSFFRPILLAKILQNLAKKDELYEDKDWPTLNDQILDSYFFGNMSKIAQAKGVFRILKHPFLLGAILTPTAILGYSAYRRQKIMRGEAMPSKFDIFISRIPSPYLVGGSALGGGILASSLAKLFKKGEELQTIINVLPYEFDLELINELNSPNFNWFNN